MEQLIKITTNDKGTKVVSARELYQFLEVGSDFTHWCKRMFDYGFIENQDYAILVKNDEKVSKTNPIDYAITLDTAKEISMIQRSEKGKLARKYFIECEKQLIELSNPKELSRKEILLLALEAEERAEKDFKEIVFYLLEN